MNYLRRLIGRKNKDGDPGTVGHTQRHESSLGATASDKAPGRSPRPAGEMVESGLPPDATDNSEAILRTKYKVSLEVFAKQLKRCDEAMTVEAVGSFEVVGLLASYNEFWERLIALQQDADAETVEHLKHKTAELASDWDALSVRLDNVEPAISCNDRGAEFFGKGQHDRAIAEYTKSISLQPKYAHAYMNRGSAWAERREYDKAIADYVEWLAKAIEKDATYRESAKNEPDFVSLHADSRFLTLLGL